MPRQPRRRTPRRACAEWACDRQSEAGLREHCVPTGRDSLPTPRPVPRGRRALAPRARRLPPLAVGP
jgi:hypothetical protein